MANEQQTAAPQSDIKLLISKGLEQGYLTYAEVNDHLPDDMVDPEQIEDIIGMINGMGIDVHEVAPDAETLLLAGEAAGNVCPGFVHPGSATTRIRPLEGLKREYSDATHS